VAAEPDSVDNAGMGGFPASIQAAYEQHRSASSGGVSRCSGRRVAGTHQDVFMKLAANEHRIEPEGAAGWLLQTATNHCLTMMRGRGRTDSLDARAEGDGEGPGDQGPSERLTGQYEARDFSRKLLEELGTVSRDIALSVLAGDEERQDVASKLNVSRKTVTRKLQSITERAKRLLLQAR
jgi:DNA-directed RNA polymerase specialized sigma24 family protein